MATPKGTAANGIIGVLPPIRLHAAGLQMLPVIKDMLQMQEKKKIIEKFKVHEKDTGSSDVQIALFTEKIEQLSEHLKTHPKDNHSRRGLLKMVAKRRKLLDYLEKSDPKRFASVAKKLKLKK